MKVAQSRAGFVAAYVSLAVVAGAAVVAFASMMTTHVRTETLYRDRQVSTMTGLRKTLGKPAQIVDGAGLGLPQGTACYAWVKGDGLYLLCPS